MNTNDTNRDGYNCYPPDFGTAERAPASHALLAIDLQNDFLANGRLAVPDGDAILAGVAKLSRRFDTVVLTQDWHPAGHSSFASSHGAAPFSQMDMPYGSQTLWPDHCVQGSPGADFPGYLKVSGLLEKANLIIRKGMNPQIDSYSAFFENDRVTPTGLEGYLRGKGITHLVMTGLAYDFCVGFSALDARRLGFTVEVIDDLCRSIKMPMGQSNSEDLMINQFREAGVLMTNGQGMGGSVRKMTP